MRAGGLRRLAGPAVPRGGAAGGASGASGGAGALSLEGRGPDTIILGGGLSGLLAAHWLRRRGHRVEVWEASDRPGGWVATVPWPGPGGEPGAFERGPQELRLRHGDALHRVVAALGLGGRASPSRSPRWLVMEGRTWDVPGGLRDLLATPLLSPGGRLRLLAEPLVPNRPARDLRTLLMRRIGPEATERLGVPLLAALVPAPLEAVGPEALPALEGRLARGGLLRGGLGEARLRGWVPDGGLGSLVEALGAELGSDLRLGQPGHRLAPCAQGWRVEGGGFTREVAQVVLALPPAAAGRLLEGVAPGAAPLLAAVPMATLRAWHSRHPGPNRWPRGFHLSVNPAEGRGILGALSLAEDDPRSVPGLVQVRTYLGGGFPGPAGGWPEVEGALRRWIPALGEALQVVEDVAEAAFPLPAPGHRTRMAALHALLPPGVDWIGAARFGAGVGDLAEGILAWADAFQRPPASVGLV